MKKNKTILITGASSGIGKALAEIYAAPDVTLLLTGRDTARLNEVATVCRAKNATVETSTTDVTDRNSFAKQLLAWDDKYPVDILITNAGISGSDLYTIMDTNLGGAFNTVVPLLPRLRERKSGHIVLMSSMAGFRGMPNAPAYSTSKTAVRAYGDALRPLLKPEGICVSTIFPGFIKTPLTDKNNFDMPFLMEVDKAAAIIKCGIDAGKISIAFPWQMHVFCWMLGVMPRVIGDWILSQGPRKEF